MRKIPLLVLMACGPSLTGTWNGSLATVSGCSNMAGNFTPDGSATWNIVDNGTLTITPVGGNCGTYIANGRGVDVWEIQFLVCPPPSGADSFFVRGGTISLLSSGALDVFLAGEISAMGLTCRGDISGTMTRG